MSGNLRLFDHGQERHGSNDYYTPAWIFEALDIEFDLDVSAPPGGVQWIPAKRYLTLADDGLTADWHGRVWMNPPYSNTTPWARRFITHANGIALLPHAKAIWHSEMMAQAEATCTPPRYFDFVGTDNRNGDIFLPVFFAAFGTECVEALRNIGPIRKVA